MTIAIHQPNFFPYYPYFQKMMECDLFVILSQTQFRKGGYENRFNVGDKWHTMSVNSGLQPIGLKRYVSPDKDFGYIKKAFRSKELWRFDKCISQSLFATNVNIINAFKQILKIETPLEFDYLTTLTGTDRLIDLCKHYKANKYLSGISGKNYLELSKFQEAGIEVIFQDESKMIKKALVDML